MSDDNQTDGRNHYLTGNQDDRSWFGRQWSIWPRRADERYTTNISFLYGGVTAYRTEEGRDPELSSDFRSHVSWLDRHQLTPPTD